MRALALWVTFSRSQTQSLPSPLKSHRSTPTALPVSFYISAVMKQSSLAEVSASSAPKDVVGAIVSSAAAPPKAPNNPMKAFQVAFVFIFIFALVIYFREEIYTFSKGEQCLRAAKGACTRHADPCMHEAWSAVLHGTQSCSMRALSKPH